MVYDLGGGTFDVSLLRMEKEYLSAPTGGDVSLEDDFDWAISQWIIDSLKLLRFHHTNDEGLVKQRQKKS